MFNKQLQISVLFLLGCLGRAWAQPPYLLTLHGADSSSSVRLEEAGIMRRFPSREACSTYVVQLPAQLAMKGYIAASVDSMAYGKDSAAAVLYLGERFRWARIGTASLAPDLQAVLGRDWIGDERSALDFSRVEKAQQRLLDHFENHGYPFAKVYLDSVQLRGDSVLATLKADRGFAYKVDSIRVFGNVRISNNYLQHYLDIPNGSLYNKAKLRDVSRRLRELPFLEEEQPARLSMLATGSMLDLYLRQKKSSQVNLLVGFLPNNNQLASKKMLITGEGLLNLKNALGAGETIGLSFQALQVESQRLNAVYQHPFLFRSPFGLDFAFDIFRKDSSFVNIHLQLGVAYVLNTRQSGKLFLQRFQTYVGEGGFNQAQLIATRRLPANLDVRSVAAGLDYEYNNTDYRYNPRSGYEIRFTGSAGTKQVKRNNTVLGLKDPADPSFDFGRLYDTLKLNTYQLRLRLQAARFWPLSNKRATVKTGLQGGYFQSGNVFRNEMFQVGGYKLLRGFDEESQYLSQFAIATAEFRYLVGINSYFYVLADGGWGRDAAGVTPVDHTYFGTGLGMAFETKAGIFNLAWAVGKRNDSDLSLRQSKIHFGFINYF